MPRTALDTDGRNLTDVLLYLQLNELELFAELRTIMRSAFPDVRQLSVHQDVSENVTSLSGEPVVYFDGRSRPIPLRLCGTGLEQMLALAVGILTAREARLFLIDEPQAYLHPHAERSLLLLLEQHHEHQYIVASHSHVLLRARPLSQVRLMHLDDGWTRIVDDARGEQLLDELGVTAADLWLADRLLWVEGPSEEEVFGAIADKVLTSAQLATLAIRRMPEAASRFASKNQASAQAAYTFCSETTAAVAPLPVRMRFVFDADEKSEHFRAQMQIASSEQAVFLPMRELENTFLHPLLILAAMNELTSGLGLDPPDPQDVQESLATLLAADDDDELYPSGRTAGADAQVEIRASRVLDRLWWKFATARYDKVRDGQR